MTEDEIKSYTFPEEIRGAMLYGDIEANGLLEDIKKIEGGQLVIHKAADRIWMACYKMKGKGGHCYDFINDDILKTHRREIERHNRTYQRKNVTVLPLSLLGKFTEHVGVQCYHNGCRFDFPLMRKLINVHVPREKMLDTLVQSQTQFSDRPYVDGSTSGPHSIESWALRIGKGEKVVHEDWLNFSVDMYRRCYRDVEILEDVHMALEAEREADLIECNIDWTEALHTEHMAAFWISHSEAWGFPFDKEHAENLVARLDKRLAEIEDELIPTMPFRMDYERCGTKINWETYQEAMLKFSGLSRIPDGFGWPEDSGNKPQPVWKPFNKDGSISSSVETYWMGKDAQLYQPEVHAIEAVEAVKDEKGKVIQKAIRAKKAKPAVEAKDRIPSAYEDDAGLQSPSKYIMTHEDVGGPFTRIKWANYNLGSNDQVLEYLQRYTTWVPSEFTEKGNPRLTEDSFDTIGGSGVGEMLKEYLITKARRTTILNFKDPSKGWINHIRPDGRITPVNNPMATPTSRSKHSRIVNVPSGGAMYGAEMRRCFTAYDVDSFMIGADASGLELRCLAHEMGDEETTREIVDGDIHTVFWQLNPDMFTTRGVAKGPTYALLNTAYKIGDFKWKHLSKNLVNSGDTLLRQS